MLPDGYRCLTRNVTDERACHHVVHAGNKMGSNAFRRLPQTRSEAPNPHSSSLCIPAAQKLHAESDHGRNRVRQHSFACKVQLICTVTWEVFLYEQTAFRAMVFGNASQRPKKQIFLPQDLLQKTRSRFFFKSTHHPSGWFRDARGIMIPMPRLSRLSLVHGEHAAQRVGGAVRRRCADVPCSTRRVPCCALLLWLMEPG